MNKLKKLLTVVFTAFLAITLAACGATSSNNNGGGEKKEIKIGRAKVLVGVLCFLAISLLFIREDIVPPLPDSFTDAGRILLELGFGKESGGIAGGLIAMPLHQIITTTVMGIFLWMVVGLSIIYLLYTPLEYFYEWIKGLKQYYKSDE